LNALHRFISTECLNENDNNVLSTKYTIRSRRHNSTTLSHRLKCTVFLKLGSVLSRLCRKVDSFTTIFLCCFELIKWKRFWQNTFEHRQASI